MAPEQPTRNDSPWWRFVISSLPGWAIAVAVTVMLSRMGNLPVWGAALLIAVWIATDLGTFPRRRHYFSDDLATRRIVGEEGFAVSDVAPEGFVRVHGELWQARTPDATITIRKGAALRVRDVHGLELVVEPRSGLAAEDEFHIVPLPLR